MALIVNEEEGVDMPTTEANRPERPGAAPAMLSDDDLQFIHSHLEQGKPMLNSDGWLLFDHIDAQTTTIAVLRRFFDVTVSADDLVSDMVHDPLWHDAYHAVLALIPGSDASEDEAE